jgi:hypothetical protein
VIIRKSIASNWYTHGRMTLILITGKRAYVFRLDSSGSRNGGGGGGGREEEEKKKY